MSDIIIDTMSDKDVDPIILIEQASFNHPWSKIAFINELANKYSHNFVLKLENSNKTYQIIAYLCFRLITDELHILKIAVHPEHRDKGIAVKFLNHCLLDLCKHRVASATLEVRELNTAGIGLYKKIGFVIEGQIPNYYPDTREDQILMRKNF